MEDARIIELFFERDQQAICELHTKYGKVCHKLSYNIVNNMKDAEECVNDAYLGVWNTIPPAKPESLQAYTCKIVRNLSLKLFHRNEAAKRKSAYTIAMQEIEAYLPATNTVEREIEAKELAAIIDAFLDTLNIKNRIIFMRRYAYFDTYAEIAKHVGLSEKAVSVRLVRIRQNMRQYLTEREVLV